MATQQITTPPRLSSLFRSPYLRSVFDRAERDPGAAPADLPRPVAPLQGGSAKARRELAFA